MPHLIQPPVSLTVSMTMANAMSTPGPIYPGLDPWGDVRGWHQLQIKGASTHWDCATWPVTLFIILKILISDNGLNIININNMININNSMLQDQHLKFNLKWFSNIPGATCHWSSRPHWHQCHMQSGADTFNFNYFPGPKLHVPVNFS